MLDALTHWTLVDGLSIAFGLFVYVRYAGAGVVKAAPGAGRALRAFSVGV